MDSINLTPEGQEQNSIEQKPIDINEVIEALKKAGITCRSCWWQEGGRCYKEPCERVEIPGRIGSYSMKMADEICEDHKSKRSVLGQFFPADKLIIISENLTNGTEQ